MLKWFKRKPEPSESKAKSSFGFRQGPQTEALWLNSLTENTDAATFTAPTAGPAPQRGLDFGITTTQSLTERHVVETDNFPAAKRTGQTLESFLEEAQGAFDVSPPELFSQAPEISSSAPIADLSELMASEEAESGDGAASGILPPLVEDSFAETFWKSVDEAENGPPADETPNPEAETPEVTEAEDDSETQAQYDDYVPAGVSIPVAPSTAGSKKTPPPVVSQPIRSPEASTLFLDASPLDSMQMQQMTAQDAAANVDGATVQAPSSESPLGQTPALRLLDDAEMDTDAFEAALASPLFANSGRQADPLGQTLQPAQPLQAASDFWSIQAPSFQDPFTAPQREPRASAQNTKPAAPMPPLAGVAPTLGLNALAPQTKSPTPEPAPTGTVIAASVLDSVSMATTALGPPTDAELDLLGKPAQGAAITPAAATGQGVLTPAQQAAQDRALLPSLSYASSLQDADAIAPGFHQEAHSIDALLGPAHQIAPDTSSLPTAHAVDAPPLSAGPLVISEVPIALPIDVAQNTPEWFDKTLQLVQMTPGEANLALVWRPATGYGLPQLVKRFVQLPLGADTPDLMLTYQASIAGKHLFRAQLGHWEAVLSADTASVRVHTVIREEHMSENALGI
ncbi:MAG: hypothetical protein VKJ06_08730 [Vampirovibrionales bacterium]|nr:hypothetical protein [Vampirovibrionales bacterium]